MQLSIIVICTVILLLGLMFRRGYNQSKKELEAKELSFREELISIIKQNNSLSNEDEITIRTLPSKGLDQFLDNKQMIEQATFIKLFNKHFG